MTVCVHAGSGGENESGSRGIGSALFSVALNMLMDPGMMQQVGVHEYDHEREHECSCSCTTQLLRVTTMHMYMLFWFTL